MTGAAMQQIAATMSTFSIKDRGLLIRRDAPEDVLDSVDARRASVLRTLEILRPVVRPLALEVSFGPLEPDTLAVSSVDVRRVAVRGIPAGIANQSAFQAAAPLELVDELTPDVIARVLTPPQSGWDFATIRASVTAARVTATELKVDRWPSHVVPVIELDGERWAVGPLDAHGYRLAPPIALSWDQSYGNVQLTVEAFWDLWWLTSSAEYAGLRAVEQALDAAGFSPPPA